MCKAYKTIIKKSTKIEPGSVLNLGSGKCQTVQEIVEIISKLMNKEYIFEDTQIEPGEKGIHELCSDNTEIMKKTGWKNEVNLTEGLAKTIEWYRNNLSLYQENILH